MFLARIALFRLQESPKFLTAANRHDEAVIALQKISNFNGNDRTWGLKDVVDDDGGLGYIQGRTSDHDNQDGEGESKGRRAKREMVEEEDAGDEMDAFVLGGEEEENEDERYEDGQPAQSQHPSRGLHSPTGYNSTAETSTLHNNADDAMAGAMNGASAIQLERTGSSAGRVQGQQFPPRGPPPSLLRHPSRTPLQSRRLASYRSGSGSGSGRPRNRRQRGNWMNRLPRGLRDSVDEYMERLDELFEPKWRRTTTLIWMIWFLASAGYTVSCSLPY